MRNYKISRRNFLAVAGTLTAAAALTACGGSASSTVASSTASSSVASDSTPAAASGTGKVTVYMPSPAGLADKLAEGKDWYRGRAVSGHYRRDPRSSGSRSSKPCGRCSDSGFLVGWSVHESR